LGVVVSTVSMNVGPPSSGMSMKAARTDFLGKVSRSPLGHSLHALALAGRVSLAHLHPEHADDL